MARDRLVSASRVSAALGGCLALTACVTDGPDEAAAPTPLFRADIGEIPGGVAPGPRGVWYVPREPVRFVRIGVASWAGEPPGRRWSHWLSRLFRTAPATDAEPTAIAAADLGLPTPSRVQVTDVATGKMITLRVETTARLDDAIVQLPAAAAKELGADPRQALLVRLRYVAPMFAYEGRAPLRYALRGPLRAPAPAAEPPPLLLAAFDPPMRKAAPELALALRGALSPPSGMGFDMFRVQAGAFSSRLNAERAAALLASSGETSVEPLKRGAVTLYRVVVAAPQTAGEPEGLRARVAQTGFPDAWVLRPL